MELFTRAALAERLTKLTHIYVNDLPDEVSAEMLAAALLLREPEPSDLLPCPFCGGEAREGVDNDVFCLKCPGQVHTCSRADARSAWNSRAVPSEPSDEDVARELAMMWHREAAAMRYSDARALVWVRAVRAAKQRARGR